MQYSPDQFNKATRNISVAELARAIGKSLSSVLRYRRGASIPNAVVIGKVAAITNHRVGYFFLKAA